MLAGPLLAAGILTVGTEAAVFAAAAVACLIAAASTIGLRPMGGLAVLDPGTQPDAERDPSFLAGLRLVLADPDARLIVGLLTGRQLMIGCADVLFVLLAM